MEDIKIDRDADLEPLNRIEMEQAQKLIERE
jgi:hypothetical protein